jgi:hypothetical protein
MAKLDPAKVAAAIKASIDNPKIKKHSDGQSLYLLTRDGLGWWQYQWREGASSRSKMLGSARYVARSRASGTGGTGDQPAQQYHGNTPGNSR